LNTAVGLVAGTRHQDEGDVMQLVSLWVHPSFRRAGVAHRLVAELLTWAHSEGATTVRLDVVKDNTLARRLYERLGFHVTGTEHVRARDRVTETEMEHL